MENRLRIYDNTTNSLQQAKYTTETKVKNLVQPGKHHMTHLLKIVVLYFQTYSAWQGIFKCKGELVKWVVPTSSNILFKITKAHKLNLCTLILLYHVQVKSTNQVFKLETPSSDSFYQTIIRGTVDSFLTFSEFEFALWHHWFPKTIGFFS